MSMKKILMTAVAVSALSAGAASAATMSFANSSIAGVALTNNLSTTTAEPYTVTSELITSAASTTNAIFQYVPSSATAIAAGNYLVAWTITGGTFDLTGAITYTGTASAGTNTGSASTSSATSITGSFAVVGGNAASFTLAAPILVGASKTPVTVTGTITTPSGTPIDGGTIAAQTVLDYRTGLKFVATAESETLTLASGFKNFAAAAAYAELATVVGLKPNSNVATGATTDEIYSNLTGTAATAAALVSTVKLTVAGSLSAAKVRVSSVSGTGGTVVNADAGTTDTVTATAAVLTGLLAATPTATVGLAQLATPVAGVESAYTVTPVVTMASASYTAPTFSAKSIGSVTFAGTSYYAPWVGDGTNGISYALRVTNPSTTTAIVSVKTALANSVNKTTSGTVAQSATCDMGPIAAASELLITSAKLAACFGNFGRGDVTIIVNGSLGGTAAAGGTVKMRTVSVNGTVTDMVLGKGATVAVAQ